MMDGWADKDWQYFRGSFIFLCAISRQQFTQVDCHTRYPISDITLVGIFHRFKMVSTELWKSFEIVDIFNKQKIYENWAQLGSIDHFQGCVVALAAWQTILFVLLFVIFLKYFLKFFNVNVNENWAQPGLYWGCFLALESWQPADQTFSQTLLAVASVCKLINNNPIKIETISHFGEFLDHEDIFLYWFTSSFVSCDPRRY